MDLGALDDPAGAREMGETGREKTLSGLSWDVVAERVFPDHHAYPDDSLRRIYAFVQSLPAPPRREDIPALNAD